MHWYCIICYRLLVLLWWHKVLRIINNNKYVNANIENGAGPLLDRPMKVSAFKQWGQTKER